MGEWGMKEWYGILIVGATGWSPLAF